jgi:hypothetical protein
VVLRALDAGIIREEMGFVTCYVVPDGIVDSADVATTFRPAGAGRPASLGPTYKHFAPLGRLAVQLTTTTLCWLRVLVDLSRCVNCYTADPCGE